MEEKVPKRSFQALATKCHVKTLEKRLWGVKDVEHIQTGVLHSELVSG